MAIISADTFESYPASVTTADEVEEYLDALASNLELCRKYGLGTSDSGAMTTIAQAVKNDDISGSYDNTDSPITGLVSDEKIILNESSGAITYTLAASGYSNGHVIKFVRTSATNDITISRNGHNINGSASDYTWAASGGAAGEVLYLEYWGSSFGWTAKELS